jgi:hypothetical protein
MIPSGESQTFSSSDPPDPDPSGFDNDPQAPHDEKRPMGDKPFPVMLPEGLTKDALMEWAFKKKKRHQRWFGDSNGQAEKVMNAWKAYTGKMMAGQASPSHIPLSNSIIETDTAKSYQAAFSRAKVVDAQPRSQQFDNENKTTIEDLMNQELLFSQARTGEKAFDFMKGLKIEGTAFGRVSWEERELETIPPPVMLKDPIGGDVPGAVIGEVRMIKKVHGPTWEGVPMQNLIWDDRESFRIQNSEFVAHRQFPTTTDLLLMEEKGDIQDVNEIEKIAESTKLEQQNPDLKRKQLLGPGSVGPSEGTQDESVRLLDEWFGWIPYHAPQANGTKKWEKVSLHFMIVNDKTLVKCEPNPWTDESGGGPHHPFFSCRQSLMPRELLGNSVLFPIMGLQVDANNLHESVGKLIKKVARNPTFVSRAAGLDTLRLFQDELSIIAVTDPEKVKSNPIDGNQIKAVSAERQWVIQQAQETVAANEQAQGVPDAELANATATAAAITNANNGTRFQLFVDMFSYEFFAGMANLFWWSIRKWAKDGDLVVRESTLDGAPREITREDLVNDYFFVPVTSAALNDSRAQLQSQMQIAQQLGQLQVTNPQAMIDGKGNMWHFDVMDFILKEILPKAGVRNGRSYFSMHPVAQPGTGAGLPPGAPGAPAGAPAPAGPPIAPQPGFVPGTPTGA